MLVVAARPGTWLMRCDAQGKVQQQLSLEESSARRFCGHADVAANGEVLLTTETEYGKGRGRIGVRDRRTLQKLDEWDTILGFPILNASGPTRATLTSIPTPRRKPPCAS